MKHSKLFNQIRKNNEAVAAQNLAKLKEAYEKHLQSVERKQSADEEVKLQLASIQVEHMNNTDSVKERGANAEAEEK